MNIKKHILVAGGVTSLAIAGVATAGSAWADTSTASKDDSLITKLAQKFNLKEADVKAVFEEDKSARKAERQQAFEQRLDQAVTDKKITSKQKDKILAKVQELKAYIETLKDKTPEERHDLLDAKKDELKKWAEDNGIPKEYLRFVGARGGHGQGGPGRFAPHD